MDCIEKVEPGQVIFCTDDRGRQQVRDRLRMVGDRWSLVVVSLLAAGPLRFTELMREADGISHRMLTKTLRGLARDGLVTRTAYAEVPPRVEYDLTELGHTLLEPITGLAAWVETHLVEIDHHRAHYDLDGPT
ncbi:winged helix-turn-helix transcriptional regulator [Microlunatus speluncae]|uniref:winged helix-turn-helix transcriptional regulator n=1 Tax=Microlunatus speluncae TaxID=2594267 RepID=UPI001FE8386C|nr:helix-turn-helix domain-containing protein [Microlunatus speluncae]